MPPENAETVRRFIAAWSDGDLSRAQELLAEDAELLPLRARLEGTSYRGRDGLQRAWDDLDADWEDLKLPSDELREVGDKVVVLGRLTGRGRTSGVELDVPTGQLWELRDGLIVRIEAFSDPADALRVAGLS